MTATIEKLRADIAEIIGLPVGEVGDEDNLMDLGLDSIRVMTLALKWEQEGLRLDFATLAEEMTLAVWARAVTAAA